MYGCTGTFAALASAFCLGAALPTDETGGDLAIGPQPRCSAQGGGRWAASRAAGGAIVARFEAAATNPTMDRHLVGTRHSEVATTVARGEAHDSAAEPDADPPEPRRDPPPPAGADPLTRWDDNRNGQITCSEARRHGIAPVPRGHPAYPYMHDRDGDGVVCE